MVGWKHQLPVDTPGGHSPSSASMTIDASSGSVHLVLNTASGCLRVLVPISPHDERPFGWMDQGEVTVRALIGYDVVDVGQDTEQFAVGPCMALSADHGAPAWVAVRLEGRRVCVLGIALLHWCW